MSARKKRKVLTQQEEQKVGLRKSKRKTKQLMEEAEAEVEDKVEEEEETAEPTRRSTRVTKAKLNTKASATAKSKSKLKSKSKSKSKTKAKATSGVKRKVVDEKEEEEEEEEEQEEEERGSNKETVKEEKQQEAEEEKKQEAVEDKEEKTANASTVITAVESSSASSSSSSSNSTTVVTTGVAEEDEDEKVDLFIQGDYHDIIGIKHPYSRTKEGDLFPQKTRYVHPTGAEALKVLSNVTMMTKQLSGWIKDNMGDWYAFRLSPAEVSKAQAAFTQEEKDKGDAGTAIHVIMKAMGVNIDQGDALKVKINKIEPSRKTAFIKSLYFNRETNRPDSKVLEKVKSATNRLNTNVVKGTLYEAKFYTEQRACYWVNPIV